MTIWGWALVKVTTKFQGKVALVAVWPRDKQVTVVPGTRLFKISCSFAATAKGLCVLETEKSALGPDRLSTSSSSPCR